MTPLLEARALSRTFPLGFGAGRSFRALHDVSFTVARGESVALVGESGCGKSTLARLLVRLDAPSAGTLLLDGRDVRAGDGGFFAPGPSKAFRRRVQMVFQDPFGSLNPAHTIGHHLERPLRLHHPGVDTEARVRDLLDAAARRGDLRAPLPARSGTTSPVDAGCPFAPRCPLADHRCRASLPLLHAASGARAARCHLVEPM